MLAQNMALNILSGVYYNNNNIYLLQLGCHPVAVVSPGGSF